MKINKNPDVWLEEQTFGRGIEQEKDNDPTVQHGNFEGSIYKNKQPFKWNILSSRNSGDDFL